MTITRAAMRRALFVMLLGLISSTVFAQPPVPAPEPGGEPNVFYGTEPPSPGYQRPAPVIVFVPGLAGTARDWFSENPAYEMAFRAGFRTAFISLNADNTPNNAGIEANAAVLRTLLPKISKHFGGAKFYMVGHSKGGLDIQAAMLTPSIRSLVRAVFTISTPNQGTELADWAFGPGLGIAATLNLLTPGVFSLRTENVAVFRKLADPILKASGIPFYTIGADKFSENPLTLVTGAILGRNAGSDIKNDGFVTVKRSRLPGDYAVDLGTIHADHFSVDNGDQSFQKISGRIQALEIQYGEFERIAKDGLGDNHNNWFWSQAWFQGKLYVGTGREIQCMSLKSSDVQLGTPIYPLAVLVGDCPEEDVLRASLAAEIWRFDPADGSWMRVYKSPEDLPVGTDRGETIFSARDVGYRGMIAFTERDGTEALYVGAVTSGSIYDVEPVFPPDGFPPPRLLRSLDGVTFDPVPQEPGTFLGDLAKRLPGSQRRMRSFRALTAYKGRLFATVGDFRGVGYVVASSDPNLGNDAWVQASPIAERFPVWQLAVYNDFLYATTGDAEFSDEGYGVYKTDASGPAPYVWRPVVTRGGYQADPRVRAPNGLSMAVFKGQLYIGTNRPTELIRVNADDTWDLVVGESRKTPHGFKTPISGFGIGFGTWMNGHFWRMAVHGEYLYLTTWDWSVGLRFLEKLDQLYTGHYGFDMYRTTDGVHWEAVTRTGMDDGVNSGGRTILSTPGGLFLGTARPGGGGASLYRCAAESCGDPAVEAPGTLVSSPKRLEAVSEDTAGRQAILSWDPVPGAVLYRVYRATAVGLDTFLPGILDPIHIPGIGDVTFEDIRNGALDFLCTRRTPEICIVIAALKTSTLPDVPVALPVPFVQVAITSNTVFSETARNDHQSLYYVRAQDAQGNLSRPSNFVGAPSKTAAVPVDATPPEITPVLSSPSNAAGWHNTPVTVSWSIADVETGVASRNGCEPVTLSSDTAGVTLTCHASNGRGLAATGAVAVKLDVTPPSIQATRNVPPNARGWANTDVTVMFAASDALSRLASVSGPVTLTSEGANQTVTGIAVDGAGNRAVASAMISIDKTPPEASLRFNPITRDLAALGRDSLSGVGAAGAMAPAVVERGFWGRRDDDDDENDEQEGRRWHNRTQRRTYRVVDNAGNAVSLRVDVRRDGTQAKGELLTVQYGDGPRLRAPENRLRFDWSLAKKSGALDTLEQSISVDEGRSRYVAHALYDARTNETRMRVSRPKPRQRTVFAGLVLLRLETLRGKTDVEFGEER